MPLNTATQEMIIQAYREDVGSGDCTSDLLLERSTLAQAQIVAKDVGVVSGQEVAAFVFAWGESKISYRPILLDGALMHPGDVLAEIEGPAWGVLQSERTALNFLQRLSGVATTTRAFVDAIGERATHILDTRKTTPGWRLLQKQAVVHGWGTNHRQGLYDQVLIKENHLYALMLQQACDLNTAIELAIQTCRTQSSLTTPIEVEVQTVEQACLAGKAGADVILLDNMSCEDMSQVVKQVALLETKPLLEASGGIDLDRVRLVAATGVDQISVGALTHSYKAIDLSLLIQLSYEV